MAPKDAAAEELHTTGPGVQEYGMLDKMLQLFAVYVWLGWLCTILISLAVLAVVSWPARFTIIAIFLVGALTPIPKATDTLGPMYAAVGNFLMRRAAQYFSLKVQMSGNAKDELERLHKEDKPVVIGLEPHAVIPFSIFFGHPAISAVPLRSARGLMSSILFLLPGMRQTYTSVSASDSNKKTMYALLDKGISCTLIPGGVQEVNLLNKGTDKDLHLFLNKRLGFVKVALEKGAPVVPAFCFGILDTYDWWIVPGEIAAKIGRNIGFYPMLYFGAYGIPLGIPKKVPLTIIVGEPIQGPALPKVPTDATDEQQKKVQAEIDSIVVATHARYVEAMRSLFEDNKERNGMGDFTLHIE